MNNIEMDVLPLYQTQWTTQVLHLDQKWNMFSPQPPTVGGWHIIEGILQDTTLELHRNRGMFEWKGIPLGDWGPPDSIPETLGNHRWFKFYEVANAHEEHSSIRRYWGRFICREWNKRHQGREKLYELKIWWLSYQVNLDGSRGSSSKEMQWHHFCYKSKPTP